MIDNAKLQITYCHITAPIGGRVGLRLVDMGNFVQASASTSLVVITQLQPIAVIFTIPQNDIFRVQQKFASGEDLLVEAWDDKGKKKLANGKLLAIDNLVDTTTGTVRLKSEFQNEDNLLFPNEFVNSKLLIDTRHASIIVPTGAIQRGPKGSYAFVVKADKTVEMRSIKVGPTEGDQTIIASGVEAGEIVVTEGTDKLISGSQVEVRTGQPKSKTAPGKDAKAPENPQATSDAGSANQPPVNQGPANDGGRHTPTRRQIMAGLQITGLQRIDGKNQIGAQ